MAPKRQGRKVGDDALLEANDVLISIYLTRVGIFHFPFSHLFPVTGFADFFSFLSFSFSFADFFEASTRAKIKVPLVGGDDPLSPES